jgi:hypothetical protein
MITHNKNETFNLEKTTFEKKSQTICFKARG